MAHVLDYSGWRPNPQDLKSAGIVGVSRYLASSAQSWKVIGKAEYDRTLAAGLTVVLNWEETAGSWRGGYATGANHGAMARTQARALGHPDERPIIQSVDTAVTPAELSVALAYQRGFNDGGGRGPQGIYGTGYVIDACFAQGLVRVGWQTAARGWYGNRDDSIHSALIQRTSKSYPQFPPAAYDENTIHKADWGQHPSPSQPPPPPPEEPPMAFITFTDAGSPLCVAADCSSKFFLTAADARALLVEAGYKTANLDQATIDRIPDLGHLQLKMDTLIAAVLAVDVSNDVTLTPEQIAAISASITVPPVDTAAIAKAAAAELGGRIVNG